jgi:hypothetical protein
VGGGYANRAGNDAGSTTDEPFATVAGGRNNTASGFASTVSGGSNGTAFGNNSTISGGLDNVANGFSSIVAGGSENTANGIYSFVAGFSNTTSGTASFAAGRGANANFDGCFVWGDSSTDNGVTCGAANRFVARSLGGVYFFSSGNNQATYDGVFLAPGATAWVMASNRRIKDNLQAVDTGDVLQKLVALPITTWNLKSQDPSIRHMGAMAQDFHAAFGLGETELGINTLDADGVALAAIQGLNAKVDAQAREIAGLREQHASELAKLSRAYEELLARIAAAGTVSAR